MQSNSNFVFPPLSAIDSQSDASASSSSVQAATSAHVEGHLSAQPVVGRTNSSHEDNRPTVGDFVRILDTDRTRNFCGDMIGRTAQVERDAMDSIPYKVDRCPGYLRQTDVIKVSPTVAHLSHDKKELQAACLSDHKETQAKTAEHQEERFVEVVTWGEDWTEHFQRAALKLWTHSDGSMKMFCCDRNDRTLRVLQSEGPQFELHVNDLPDERQFPLRLRLATEQEYKPWRSPNQLRTRPGPATKPSESCVYINEWQDSSIPPVSPRSVNINRSQQCTQADQLDGEWMYGEKYTYTLKSRGGGYELTDLRADGTVRFVGRLCEDGAWYSGDVSKEGQVVASIRMRKRGPNIVSNVKMKQSDVWQPDVIASLKASSGTPDGEPLEALRNVNGGEDYECLGRAAAACGGERNRAIHIVNKDIEEIFDPEPEIAPLRAAEENLPTEPAEEPELVEDILEELRLVHQGVDDEFLVQAAAACGGDRNKAVGIVSKVLGEMFTVADNEQDRAVVFGGFICNPQLNALFVEQASPEFQIGKHETYWTEKLDYFLFLNAKTECWSVDKVKRFGMAKSGQSPGVAHSPQKFDIWAASASDFWWEYDKEAGSWVQNASVSVSVQRRERSRQRLVTFTQACPQCGTDLSRACQIGHDRCVHALTETKANVEKADNTDSTPLMHSCREGHDQCTRALIQAGANIGKTNRFGGTSLMISCEHGHHQCTQALIEAKAELDKRGENGWTATMLSARSGHDQCIRALIDAGAKLDTIDQTGFTALMYACRDGHDQCTRALVESGAGLNTQNHFGGTALIVACGRGHDECTRALIEVNADLDRQTAMGRTALAISVEKGHERCIWELIVAKADLEKQAAPQ